MDEPYTAAGVDGADMYSECAVLDGLRGADCVEPRRPLSLASVSSVLFPEFVVAVVAPSSAESDSFLVGLDAPLLCSRTEA